MCTRLAGSGICTQLVFFFLPPIYSLVFFFFFPFKEFSRLFVFVSVRGGACVFCSAAARNRERFVFLSDICFLLLLLLALTTTACSRTIYRQQKVWANVTDELIIWRRQMREGSAALSAAQVNSTSISAGIQCLTRLVICAWNYKSFLYSRRSYILLPKIQVLTPNEPQDSHTHRERKKDPSKNKLMSFFSIFFFRRAIPLFFSPFS